MEKPQTKKANENTNKQKKPQKTKKQTHPQKKPKTTHKPKTTTTTIPKTIKKPANNGETWGNYTKFFYIIESLPIKCFLKKMVERWNLSFFKVSNEQ